MTRAEFAKGSVTFLAVIVADVLSTRSLNQRFAAAEANKTPTPSADPEASAPGKSSTACVGEGGAWKNWPWPNVPALSPKCEQAH